MLIDLSNNRPIWQQAGGDTNRNYAETCLSWGVILNGPGEYGAWPDCIVEMSKHRKSKKVTDIRRFSEEIQPGHLVVLRLGTNNVVAVGEVRENYIWDDSFGDIDGWDLQHIRRVNWLWSDLANPKIFPVYALKQGDTTQRLDPKSEVNNWLTTLDISEAVFKQSLVPMPQGLNFDTTIKDVAEYLYGRGVSGNSVNFLLAEFDELVRIAEWYHQSQTWPSESETLAYLVVPLLRALGWSPQRMGIEWNSVDLALFDDLPRSDENLNVVVECKKMGYSCLTAKSQAENYAKNKPNCQRLIVTDGQRYGVFLKENDSFILKAYLNLIRMRSEYPVYNARGIQEAFRIMAPEFKRL